MIKISGETVVAVSRSREVLSCELSGEEVILDCHSGVYYGLNEIGGIIWRSIDQPKSVSAIQAAILQSYDVDPEQCLHDIIGLLQRLADNGLVEVVDATGHPGDDQA